MQILCNKPTIYNTMYRFDAGYTVHANMATFYTKPFLFYN